MDDRASTRRASVPSKRLRRVVLRMSEDLLRRVDQVVVQIQARRPGGRSISRAAVIRIAIRRGLDLARIEADPALGQAVERGGASC
jgi:hypothetical protein